MSSYFNWAHDGGPRILVWFNWCSSSIILTGLFMSNEMLSWHWLFPVAHYYDIMTTEDTLPLLASQLSNALSFHKGCLSSPYGRSTDNLWLPDSEVVGSHPTKVKIPLGFWDAFHGPVACATGKSSLWPDFWVSVGGGGCLNKMRSHTPKFHINMISQP